MSAVQYRLGWAAVLLLAAALRAGAIGRESLSYDESLTVATARVPDGQVLGSVVSHENLPPGYFLLINRWAHRFGTSDVSLRLPSAICGVLAVAAMCSLGQRLAPAGVGRATGLGAGLLLAVSRYHVAYSQQARPYSLEFLLCVLSCDLFARVAEGRRERRWAAIYVVVSAAALWAQPFAGLVLAAQGLFAVATRRAVRQTLLLQAAALLLYWPWLAHLARAYETGQPWMPVPSVRFTLVRYADTGPILVVLGLLSVAGVWQMRRRPAVLLAALVAVPPVWVPILLSTPNHVLFIPRYGIAALIGIIWLVAIGASGAGRFLGAGLLLAACLLAAPNLAHDLRRGTTAEYRPDVKAAAAVVEAAARPGDSICVTDGQQANVFAVYARRSDLHLIDAVPTTRGPATVWLVTPSAPAAVAATVRGTPYCPTWDRPFDGGTVVRLTAN